LDILNLNITYRSYRFSLLKEPYISMFNSGKKALDNCYAPYSNFGVAAVLLLENGELLVGTNQENASFPVSICAERVVLSALSVIRFDAVIKSMMILSQRLPNYSENNNYDFQGVGDEPVAPCGMCRQAIAEQVTRQKEDFELLLVSGSGMVWSFDKAMSLLPLAFGTI